MIFYSAIRMVISNVDIIGFRPMGNIMDVFSAFVRQGSDL